MLRDLCSLNKCIKGKYIFPQRSPEKILESHYRIHNSQLFSGQCGTWTFIVFVVRSITSHRCKVFFRTTGRNLRRLKINKSVDERIYIAHAHGGMAISLALRTSVQIWPNDPGATKRSGSNAVANHLRRSLPACSDLRANYYRCTINLPIVRKLHFYDFKIRVLSDVNSINVSREFIPLSIVINANRQSRFFAVSDNHCDNR